MKRRVEEGFFLGGGRGHSFSYVFHVMQMPFVHQIDYIVTHCFIQNNYIVQIQLSSSQKPFRNVNVLQDRLINSVLWARNCFSFQSSLKIEFVNCK